MISIIYGNQQNIFHELLESPLSRPDVNSSQEGGNARRDFLNSYYFKIIPNYGRRETPVAMSSNSETRFLMVELDFTFFNTT